MLGTDLLATIKGYKLAPTDIHDLNVTLPESISKIASLKPNLIIHLASYTDVDGCELYPKKAWRVNSIGTKNIALACQKLGIPMVYISTDYVFDGTQNTPYTEKDLPNPINIYGKTKLEGESWIKKILNKFWIVRTSGLYGKHGKNFVLTIIKKAKEKKQLKIVTNHVGSPTYTEDLAQAIATLIETNYFGTYHITNSKWCSWHEFAKTVIEIYKLDCEILPVNYETLKRPAKRPANWRLLNFKWEKTFGNTLRPWKEALNEFLENIKNN